MPTPTYDLIASTTLTASTSSVVFGSLPQTYRDLILVHAGVATVSNTYIFLRFNGDTGSNYNYVFMFGDGSSTASSTFSNQTQGYIGNLEPNSGTGTMNTLAQIMDYSASDKHKTILSRNNDHDGLVISTATRWANTAAITSMSVSVNANQFAVGSTFNLYGIVA